MVEVTPANTAIICSTHSNYCISEACARFGCSGKLRARSYSRVACIAADTIFFHMAYLENIIPIIPTSASQRAICTATQFVQSDCCTSEKVLKLFS